MWIRGSPLKLQLQGWLILIKNDIRVNYQNGGLYTIKRMHELLTNDNVKFSAYK